MFSIFKKSIKYFIIVAGVVILLPTLFYLALQVPYVQTLIVKRITSHFSSEVKSTISVGSFNYKFFNRLTLTDILIKDKNNDTMIYSQIVNVSLKNFDLKNKSFRLGKVTLTKPYIAFITDSTGLMNLTWYLNLLKNPSDTIKKPDLSFVIDEVDLSDARFSLINRQGGVSKAKIDFNNLNISGLNGIIEELKLKGDSTSFNIYNLGFKDQRGFTVNKINSSVLIAKQKIQLNSTFIICDSSIIEITRLGLKTDSSGSFKRFTEDVRLDMLLEKSLFNTSDLGYFLPIPPGVNETIWISGKISGTVAELRGRNIKLEYRNYTSLDCDFDLSGLPKIENTFIHVGVNSLKTNAIDIDKIYLPEKGYLIIPEAVYKLGDMLFDGSFTGFTTDFVTYGKFRTSNGTISTDISLRPEESNRYRIKGLIKGSEINLGELTGNSELLGQISMEANIDGFASSLNKFAANLTGKIDSIEVKKYKYRNIDLKGYFTEKTWDGSIKIAEKNIRLDLLGMFNFAGKLPEFDFTMDLAEANLFNLNLVKADTFSTLSILLTSNFKGNSIDNLDGEIKLLNSNYKRHNKVLELSDFSIKTYKEANKPVLILRTDYVDADIRGYYNFASIGNLVKSTLATLMPSQFDPPVIKAARKNNNFVFNINFKNTDKINDFFQTGVLLSDKSTINGSVFTDSLISISARAKSLSFKNNEIKDLAIDALTEGPEMSIDLNSSAFQALGQSELKEFSVKLKTKPDNFIFVIDWDNKDKILNKGNFTARGYIAKSQDEKSNAILNIEIDSTHIYTKNNLWNIRRSSVHIDSNAVNLNNLYVSSKDRFYRIDGSVSENPKDTLNLEFRGIDIAPLNYLGNQQAVNDPEKIQMNIRGILNGKIMLTNVYKNLLLEADIIVNNFSILGSEYGNISIKSDLDNARKILNINAGNNLAGVKMFDIKGIYDPASKKINLDAKADKLPIEALNPLLKVFASDITGFASGKVNLSGKTNNLVLQGAVKAENASMKIDYLQARFKLSDTIRFDKKGFRFNNVKLTDEKGSMATLSGYVYHKNFKEFSADIVVNIPRPNEVMVLNTKPKDNEMFYGIAYASGLTTIKSGPNSLAFDISARTGKGTKFNIPLNSGLSVSDYSFISFFDADKHREGINDSTGSNTGTLPNAPKQLGMDINFDLEVTPDAEVQIIFDSKVGDIMKGRGSGNLNITLNRKGDFLMTGDYIFEEGDYLFTLKNILNKSFSVENGGKITFNGDLDNAEIDIKAIYKVKTSLVPIMGEEYTERVDVQCQLYLTGKLFNPVVALNIELPNSDEQTRSYLRNVISTDEELSRQFLYLLVMNSFLADASSTSSTAGTGTSAMAVTTTEMLSNQLSNWLSQINNDFDIGFVWRPGTKDLNSQDLQFALSTQVLNNKVAINSNVGYTGIGSTTEDANQLTGDFDAEIKLTEKLRLKVFNRFNNTYSGKGPYTQGIGIFFKEDFDKFSDLFKKRTKSEAKKEKEITPAEN
jgi:hypothetical protein